MKVALHMRARRDAIDAYDRTHRNVRTGLTDAIRSAGAPSRSICRGSVDLCHVIEFDNHVGPLATLASMPANTAWQAHMGDLIDFARGCSAAGADRGLPVA